LIYCCSHMQCPCTSVSHSIYHTLISICVLYDSDSYTSRAGGFRRGLDQLLGVSQREGYSAELYRYLDGKDQGAGKRRALFVSWAKYSDKWVNDLAEEQFNRVAEVTYEIRKAEAIPYLETTRTMNKYGKIRAVVIESGRD